VNAPVITFSNTLPNSTLMFMILSLNIFAVDTTALDHQGV
jgi:hypothetical protein